MFDAGGSWREDHGQSTAASKLFVRSMRNRVATVLDLQATSCALCVVKESRQGYGQGSSRAVPYSCSSFGSEAAP